MRKSVMYGMIGLFLVASDNFAQTPEWVTYTKVNFVTKIKGGDNFLWITTDQGLVRLDKNTENINFYNSANAGLPSNDLRSLAVDSSGNIWVGTRYNGIGLFDGENCIVYNSENSGLPFDQHNYDIEIDNNGIIWISSCMFLSRFDGTNWFSCYTGDFRDAYNQIWDITFDRDGNVWVGASWGVGKFDGEKVVTYSEIIYDVRAIAFDSDNTVWIGTHKYGLVSYDGESWNTFTTENSGLPSNDIYALEFDSQENLWVGTINGLVKFDGTNWDHFTSENSGLTNNYISCLEIDSEDTIWIGSYGCEVFKYDGFNWKKYILSNSGMTSSNISSFAIDTNGNKWIAYYRDLMRFDGLRWETYDISSCNRLDSYFQLIYQDSLQKFWKGFGVTISLSDSIFNAYNTNNLQSGSKLHIDNHGNIWQASDNGIMKFDGTNWIIYNMDNSPLPSNRIMEIAFDSQGNLWAGTEPHVEPVGDNYKISSGGLVKFDGENWEVYLTQTITDTHDIISKIEIDNSGNIWLSIIHRGLIKFDGNSWTTYDSYNSGLPHNSVMALCFDEEEYLWVGTNGGGMAKFDGKDKWTIYNSKNSGLPTDNVEQIVIDAMNNKWLDVPHNGLTVFREGGVILTGVHEDKGNSQIKSFYLKQNYPNPFNTSTTIEFYLPFSDFASILIYNIMGQKVRELVAHNLQTGAQSFLWDGRDDFGNAVSSGVYFSRLKFGGRTATRKMLLLR